MSRCGPATRVTRVAAKHGDPKAGGTRLSCEQVCASQLRRWRAKRPSTMRFSGWPDAPVTRCRSRSLFLRIRA
jgi:hypothetical protein